MTNIKFLEIDDLHKYYNSRGKLKRGIKKIWFSYPHPVLIKEGKEELIKKLNWKYNFGITELIGIHRDIGTWGTYCVYYK